MDSLFTSGITLGNKTLVRTKEIAQMPTSHCWSFLERCTVVCEQPQPHRAWLCVWNEHPQTVPARSHHHPPAAVSHQDACEVITETINQMNDFKTRPLKCHSPPEEGTASPVEPPGNRLDPPTPPLPGAAVTGPTGNWGSPDAFLRLPGFPLTACTYNKKTPNNPSLPDAPESQEASHRPSQQPRPGPAPRCREM